MQTPTYNDYHIVPTLAAVELGVTAAMVLNYIAKWVIHNRKFRKNYRDGKYWTYNSIRAYGEVFPFFSTRQLRQAFAKLEAEGYIEVGVFNTLRGDRTKWYTITDKAELLLRIRTEEEIDSQIIPLPEEENLDLRGVEINKPICQNGTTICQNVQSNTNNITHHQQPDFFDDTQDLAQPPTALQTSDHFQPSQKKNFKKKVNCEPFGRAISSSTTVGCLNKENKNFKVSATEDESSAKQTSKTFLKNIITETNNDILEFYKAVFGEISIRESIALGYLTRTYGTERLLEALNRANCITEGEIKNPTAYLMTTIQRSVELEKIKRD